MSNEPTAQQIDIAEDLYFAVKHGPRAVWVNKTDSRPLDDIDVEASVDFIELARVVEKHIERALAEQREEFQKLHREWETRFPDAPVYELYRALGRTIARTYGQTEES